MVLYLSGLLTAAEVQISEPEQQQLAEVRRQRAHGLATVVGEDILTPAAGEDAVTVEVSLMPELVRIAFLEGRLTLIEARYAVRRQLSGKAFEQFCRIGRAKRAPKHERPRLCHTDPEVEAVIVAAEARGLDARHAALFRAIPLGPADIVEGYIRGLLAPRVRFSLRDDS